MVPDRQAESRKIPTRNVLPPFFFFFASRSSGGKSGSKVVGVLNAAREFVKKAVEEPRGLRFNVQIEVSPLAAVASRFARR